MFIIIAPFCHSIPCYDRILNDVGRLSLNKPISASTVEFKTCSARWLPDTPK